MTAGVGVVTEELSNRKGTPGEPQEDLEGPTLPGQIPTDRRPGSQASCRGCRQRSEGAAEKRAGPPSLPIHPADSCQEVQGRKEEGSTEASLLKLIHPSLSLPIEEFGSHEDCNQCSDKSPSFHLEGVAPGWPQKGVIRMESGRQEAAPNNQVKALGPKGTKLGSPQQSHTSLPDPNSEELDPGGPL